ncbi:hypothetical protein [Streptomyces sp. C10]|uniref:hypothetical protein n=1 Tax=Streptomyces sp. C10 TaxID=531941 RepID=UPI003980166C
MLNRWDAWAEPTADVERLAGGLTGRLKQLQAAHPGLVSDCHAFGGAARLVLTGDHAPALRRLCLSAGPRVGLVVASTGIAPDVINIHPPLVIAERDLDVMTEVLDRALTLLGKSPEGSS